MTDVLSILHEIGYTTLREDGQYYRAKPLYRSSGNETSLRIRKDTGGFVDFSANISGDLRKLIKLTTGKDIDLNDFREIVEFKELIKTTTSIRKEWESCTLVKNYNFYLKRRISKETQEQFEVMLCQSGKMTRRMVFPVKDNTGEIIGISGRAIFDSPVKWKHIGRKTEWIYPLSSIESIKEKQGAILVESIGDLLALYDTGIKNVLCLFGVEIFSKMISKLIELDVKNIIIATNNDVDNNNVGNDAAKTIQEKLLKFFEPSVINIRLPLKKDFGEMEKEEIRSWYNYGRN